MEYTSKKLAALPLAISLALLSNSALAQNAEQAADHQKIEKISVVGAATNFEVTADDIAKIQANDLSDIFRLEPSVTVGGGGLGITQLVYIRGFEDTMLNVTVDGAPQTGTLFHHIGRLSIEPELLKSVEVQAGAGEATAGSGAIGGAIRFKTKDANDLLGKDERFGGMLKIGGGTNNFDKYSATGYGRIGDNWSILASHVKIDSDSYKDGDGNEIAYEFTDAAGNTVRQTTETGQELDFIKLSGELSHGQYLSLSYETREEEGSFPSKPNFPISPSNPIYPIATERNTTVFNYGIHQGDLLDLAVTLYDTEQSLLVKGNRAWHPYQGQIETQGGDIRNTLDLGAHALTVGVEYRDQRSSAGTLGKPLNAEETGEVLGIYAQNHWDITDTLLLSFGLRYDDYSLNTTHKFYAENQANFAAVAAQFPQVAQAGFFVVADFDSLTPVGRVVGPDGTFSYLSRSSEAIEVKSDGVSANIGLAWQLTPDWKFTAGYAEALRGKEVGDTFTIDYNGVEPDVVAEEAENTEVGLEYNQDGLMFKIAAYQSTLHDAMNLEVGGTNVRNIGDIKSDGVELKLGYLKDDLRIVASYVHNNSELYNYQPNVATNAFDANGAPIVNLAAYSAQFNAFDIAKLQAPALVNGQPLVYDGIKIEGYEQRAIGNSRGDTFSLDVSYSLLESLEIGWFFTHIQELDGIVALHNAVSSGDISEVVTLRKPGYILHDFYANYDFNDDIRLRLMVKNAFDKAYRDHSSFADYSDIWEGFASHKEPGRDVRLSLSWQF
ncbi:outer membrane receptor protein [Rheinheimera sp. A13L]|uniref:TonB-dependent receptor domain-containing protein n=1 Tax=Rheinheimera sp. A13L TaxID=506534 RepID=UPI0002125047|nr:TonB-dependent receptor [Rheinheimera sp. A13L]EGM76000.1 outer membrane receptor protein [Rheinheimera sp. A13L]